MNEPQQLPQAQAQGNQPEARTPEGTLIDQSPKPEGTKDPTSTPKPEEKPTEPAKGAESKDPKDEKKSELNKDDKKGEELTGAPADGKYTDFKLPDNVVLNDKDKAEAHALFKDLNLSQAGAQKAMDTFAAKLAAAVEAPFKAFETMRNEWRTQLKADPEIGPKFDAVRADFARALTNLNNPELEKGFREAMDLTGAGDHPAFVKVFHQMAQAFLEGKPVQGAGPSKFGQQNPGDKPESAAKAMYPHLK